MARSPRHTITTHSGWENLLLWDYSSLSPYRMRQQTDARPAVYTPSSNHSTYTPRDKSSLWSGIPRRPSRTISLLEVDARLYYVNSPAFLDNDLDAGWERRDEDIVTDEFGRECFKTWRYGPNRILGHEDYVARTKIVTARRNEANVPVLSHEAYYLMMIASISYYGREIFEYGMEK
eukprot:scaffold29773_cov51-Attheya_sp.AAC.2